MLPNGDKIRRLVSVAQMYYEQNLNQSDIAESIGVSRPMVSKLLTEARELGIVTITIKQVLDAQQMLCEQVKERFGLRDAIIVREQRLQAETNMEIASAAVQLALDTVGDPQLIGIGWGSMIGKMADYLEALKMPLPGQGEVFPLIGGINASYRSYHTNELVRIFADKTELEASYLYMPAIFDSEAECKLFENTEAYHGIREKWSCMTTAILNISNYPSTPDVATAYRFGDLLTKGGAVGHFLAHYYDRNGTIIEPVHDNIIQIPIPMIKKASNVIALCACNMRMEAALGALNSGLITALAASDEFVMQLLQL